MLRHSIRLTVVAVVLATSGPVWGQEEDIESLNRQVVQLYQRGRYAAASAIAERIVARAEQTNGRDHLDLSSPLNNLAALYDAQGRYGEAEALYQRSLNLRENALGQQHQDVAQSLNNLSVLYQHQGRYFDSEPLQKRAVSIFESTLGADHPEVGKALNNLALIYKEQGRYSEAEPIYRRALAVRQNGLSPNHPDVGETLNNLGALLDVTGRYADAEQNYSQALAIYENGFGPDHPAVGNVLGNLAGLYNIVGRYDDVEGLHKRALKVLEGSLGPDHPLLGTSLNSLAVFYSGRGRVSEAEQLFKRALAINEKALGLDHPEVCINLHNLAELYTHQGRYIDAAGLQSRSVDILERAFGPDHPTVGQALNGLGVINLKLGRDYYAESLLMRSLAISEKTIGSDSPKTGLVLNNLGDVYFTRKDWKRSVAFLQRGATLTAKSVLRQTPVFASLTKAAFRLAELEKEQAPELTDEIFRMVQQARDSEAASAISQMAARTARADTALGKLVREHQDYTNQWQLLQKQLTQEISKAPALRTPTVEAEQRRRLNDIALRVASIDSLFLRDFPEFAALTDPKPISITEAQSLLGVDEALILIFDTAEWNDTPEETFVWAVTKTDSRWVRSDLGAKALLERVAALRCGLDATSWSGEGNARCNKALGLNPNKPKPNSLPFDLSNAHALYHGLLGSIEDLIVEADGTGKHLLFVPSGPLTALPLQVLVTEPPNNVETGDYTGISWLAKRHALTTLPSVATLKSLRRGARSSAAPEPFIGFGDPVLKRKCGSVTIPDKCPDEELQLGALNSLAPRSVGEIDDMNRYFSGGLADVVAIKSRLCPLPDTAFELKCVAKSLGAPTSSVVLGPDMTETRVKEFPISRYRVVHFATHGLLAGETAQLAASRSEPALVMSPPDTATEIDDGLLTASEIAGLKLDADWVVLSACNTAGGGKPGAEALTGLAKAFFYAGARALLVSHWPVNSYAATVLTSRTFAELKKEPAIGPSEAFRRAMLFVMSDPKRPGDTHPSVWAPFVVVGEGGAAVAR